MDEALTTIRAALVDAIAADHRFRRQAIQERREYERWEQRTRMAEERALDDLVIQARERAARHERTAELYERRSAELRVQVERLQSALAATRGHGRAPPPIAASSIESRFATLEIDSELRRIRGARLADTTVTNEVSE